MKHVIWLILCRTAFVSLFALLTINIYSQTPGTIFFTDGTKKEFSDVFDFGGTCGGMFSSGTSFKQDGVPALWVFYENTWRYLKLKNIKEIRYVQIISNETSCPGMITKVSTRNNIDFQYTIESLSAFVFFSIFDKLTNDQTSQRYLIFSFDGTKNYYKSPSYKLLISHIVFD